MKVTCEWANVHERRLRESSRDDPDGVPKSKGAKGNEKHDGHIIRIPFLLYHFE